MALTFTSLTSGSDGTNNADTTSTASISPSANKLILLGLHAQGWNSGSFAPDSVVGNGLTWVLVDSYTPVTDDTYEQIFVYRAMGASPSAGVVTIDWHLDSIEEHDQSEWHIIEVDGVDTSGTNGSGAIVQAVKNTGTATATPSITLAAFGSASNGTYGFFGGYGAAVSGVVGTGFTELLDTNFSNFRNDSIYTEYRTDNDTTVDMTWSDSQDRWAGIALEIKAAAAVGGGLRSLTLLGVGQ